MVDMKIWLVAMVCRGGRDIANVVVVNGFW